MGIRTRLRPPGWLLLSQKRIMLLRTEPNGDGAEEREDKVGEWVGNNAGGKSMNIDWLLLVLSRNIIINSWFFFITVSRMVPLGSLPTGLGNLELSTAFANLFLNPIIHFWCRSRERFRKSLTINGQRANEECDGTGHFPYTLSVCRAGPVNRRRRLLFTAHWICYLSSLLWFPQNPFRKVLVLGQGTEQPQWQLVNKLWPSSVLLFSPRTSSAR